MRLIKVSAPKGMGTEVAQIAFRCGIPEVTINEGQRHKERSEPSTREMVDMKVSTPHAKAFIDALLQAPFFKPAEYSIDVREPRAVLDGTSMREITRPLAATILDVDQELWQFTHINYSFVLRVMIAAALLSYGMVRDYPLLMIGGLVFLPLMPLLLAVSFGALTRQWQLVGHACAAIVTATLLIVGSAAAVAMFVEPPMLFDQFPPMIAGAIFSLLVGVAAALGTTDDVGHRQLIGLAAASQLALIPAWLGLSLVFGFEEPPGEKLTSFGVNLAGLIVGSTLLYACLHWSGELSHGAAGHKDEA